MASMDLFVEYGCVGCGRATYSLVSMEWNDNGSEYTVQDARLSRSQLNCDQCGGTGMLREEEDAA